MASNFFVQMSNMSTLCIQSIRMFQLKLWNKLNSPYMHYLQYDRQESSKIPMHAGCGKKRGKDYNSRGNPAKFMQDPRNVSRSSPASANFTREFFMRDAWKYFPRKIDL